MISICFSCKLYGNLIDRCPEIQISNYWMNREKCVYYTTKTQMTIEDWVIRS